MARFLGVLDSYIADGLVSVSSQASDNIDLLYSILGMPTIYTFGLYWIMFYILQDFR